MSNQRRLILSRLLLEYHRLNQPQWWSHEIKLTKNRQMLVPASTA